MEQFLIPGFEDLIDDPILFPEIPIIPEIPGFGDFGDFFDSFFEAYLDFYAQLLADLDADGFFDFYAQLFADLDPALFPDADLDGLAELLAGLEVEFTPEFEALVAGFDPETLTELIAGFDPAELEALILELLGEVEDILDGFVIPLLPLGGLGGWTVGDPHLQTFDGVGYSFQATGEYVLTRDAGASGFEVQARFVPAEGSDQVSVTAAIATRLADGTAVEIDAQGDAPLLVDGEAREIEDGGAIAVGDDVIARDGDTYTIVLAGADGVVGDGDSRIVVDVRDDRVDLDLRLDGTLAGGLEGLLGDGDGDASNDVALADGTVLARPFDYADLYGQFRADWRVDDAADSLFTYGAGEGPDSSYLPGFPADLVTLDDLDPDVRAAAEAAAEAAGIAPGTVNFENAVLDFALTGDASFIESSAGVPDLSDDAAVDVDPDTVVDLGPLRPVIEGTGGRDRLIGTEAAEELRGEDGRDILFGAGGGDVLVGGAGVDAFVLTGGLAPVRIADWNDGGEGRDLLAVDDQLLGLGDAGLDVRALDVDTALAVLSSGIVAYNAETGALRVDEDGVDGPGGLRTVAVIEGGGDIAITDVILG